MRPTTRWERFRKCFIWGEWGWRTFILRRRLIVVGKLKIRIPESGGSRNG